MTPLSQTIFDNYQVRKSKAQKVAFGELLKNHFPDLQVQEGGFPKNRNYILGDVTKAKLLFTAHYDTCSRMPFPNFITPMNMLFSILYAVAICIPFLIFTMLWRTLLSFVTDNPYILFDIPKLAFLLFIAICFLGPANKHTANDNTSGVITLCELIATLSPEEREKVAFIFFDNEENGMLGSLYFRKKYKKILQDKLIVNFDCVSDGDNLLLVLSKAARDQKELLSNCYQATDKKNVILTDSDKAYYPSDQAVFKRSVGIAVLKQNRFLGYYMDRIHTDKDTAFDERNIQHLVASTQRLINNIN